LAEGSFLPEVYPMTLKPPTSPNAVLAYRVLDLITAHPEHHDQAAWLFNPDKRDVGYVLDQLLADCGTTACFAGWTCLAAGDVVAEDGIRTPGVPRSVEYRAADLLGIGTDDAEQLFFDAETLTQVVDTVKEVFGPDPRTPTDEDEGDGLGLFQSAVAWYHTGGALATVGIR
jgi:hypothetical protein